MAQLWMVLLPLFLLPNPVSALVGGGQTQGYPSVFIWTGAAYALDETYCTAAKVGPRVFLSAAHCLLDYEFVDDRSNLSHWSVSKEFAAGAKIKLSFARRVDAPATKQIVVIKKVYFHPLLQACLSGGPSVYCRNTRTPLPDFALVEIQGVEDAVPFRQAPDLSISREPVIDYHPIVMMGYGHQVEDDRDPPTLKAAMNHALTLPRLEKHLQGTCAIADGMPREDAFFGAPGVLVNEMHANLGSGDSGGPVLDAGSGMIIGVNSDGYCPASKPECERTTNSLFSRLDDFALGAPAQWIENTLRMIASESQ